jgi:hypothetical protein
VDEQLENERQRKSVVVRDLKRGSEGAGRPDGKEA